MAEHIDKLLVSLRADQDQDIEAAKEWWRTSDVPAKMRVWNAIQKHYDDPAMEVMSRFAQLGYTLIALRDRPKL